MSVYATMKQAIDALDADLWATLYHDDFTFIRHQSGTSMNKAEMIDMGKMMMANDAVQFHNSRCVYENDDIIVEHSVMDFPDGSREAIMSVHMLENGKIIRSETGATPLNK